MELQTCNKCGEEAVELTMQGHCPSCAKEHLIMEKRLETRVERLYELIDDLRGETDCFVGDFNDSLSDDEREQMLKDLLEWEYRLRATGKALTHLAHQPPDWIRGFGG